MTIRKIWKYFESQEKYYFGIMMNHFSQDFRLHGGIFALYFHRPGKNVAWRNHNSISKLFFTAEFSFSRIFKIFYRYPDFLASAILKFCLL